MQQMDAKLEGNKFTCSVCKTQYLVSNYAQTIRCNNCDRLTTLIPTRPKGQCPLSQPNMNAAVDQPSEGLCRKIFKNRKHSSGAAAGAAPNYSSSLNFKSSSPRTGSSSSRTARPNKRALLCGVSYNKKKYRLKGTINDVRHMRDLLIQQFDYLPECIRVLSEEEPDEYTPTKKNIQESLKWLVEGSQSGDKLVFYFSGHGLRQPDFNNDERDGFDETICPVDFMKEGMILDNDINSTIVWPLKPGVTLHAIVDACHSGTILDLVHVYNPKKKVWEDNSPPSKAKKSTDGGLAICLSACGDDQMAADTSAFLENGMIGAMTFIFVKTMKRYHERHQEITYGVLLEEMHKGIEEANKDKCLSSRILRKIFHHRTIEDPLLSSSESFDVYSKNVKL